MDLYPYKNWMEFDFLIKNEDFYMESPQYVLEKWKKYLANQLLQK
jgi:hypothetical protein